MKTDQLKALADKTAAELNQQLTELEQVLAKTSLELKAGKLADVRQPAKLSDDIARVKGELRKRELLAVTKG